MSEPLNQIDALAAAMAPFCGRPLPTQGKTTGQDFARELSGLIQGSAAPANASAERQTVVTGSEPRQVSAAPSAQGTAAEKFAAALDAATVDGNVDVAKLSEELGGQIAYQPPDWSGSVFSLPDPLHNTWLYLPGGGRLNAAGLQYALNTLNTPENRLGALSAMVQSAEWLAKNQEAGLYSSLGEIHT